MQASVSGWNNLLCYLLLILLLSLKVKVCYILHSSPIHSAIAVFALTPSPNPIKSLALELQASWKKNKKNWVEKKDLNIFNNQIAFADCLDHSIASLSSYS